MNVNKLCIVLAFLAIVASGKDLEDSDLCTPNPCENDAVCTVSNKTMYCICKPQFFGRTCEFNSCDPNPCRNNGRCENHNGEVYCDCKEPYYGPKCEEVLDRCQDYTCSNDGKCRMDGEKVKCDCVGPFTGDICDTIKEFCLEDTCKNGGVCKIENDQYKCDCSKEYSGKNCEIESSKAIKGIDYCYTEPCKNDGICENLDYDYKCECKGTYTGKNCNEKIPASTVADINSSIPTTKLIHEDNTSKITRRKMVSNLTNSSNYEVEKNSTLSYTSEGITKTSIPNVYYESELIPNVTSSENNTTNQETTTVIYMPITKFDRKISKSVLSLSSNQTTSTVRVAEPTTSSSIDKDLAIEIRSCKSSSKTALYICGSISSILGIFLLVSGVLYYSNRVKTVKRLQYFHHEDSSSVGSAERASNLA